VYVGEGDWLKTSYGGGGSLKTSECPHMGERSKIAQKCHMIFERFRCWLLLSNVLLRF